MSRMGKPTDTADYWLPSAGGKGDGESLLTGAGVPFGAMESSRIACVDGCAAL